MPRPLSGVSLHGLSMWSEVSQVILEECSPSLGRLKRREHGSLLCPPLVSAPAQNQPWPWEGRKTYLSPFGGASQKLT